LCIQYYLVTALGMCNTSKTLHMVYIQEKQMHWKS